MAPQPFIPLANGAQVEFVSNLLGEVVENRLWFISRFDPIDAGLIQALAVGASAWYRSQVYPLLSSSIALSYVKATDWTDDPPPFTYTDFTGAFGGVVDNPLSANVSVRVAFKGDNTQNFPNNSNFVPGIPKNAVNGNYYTEDIKDGLFEAYVALIDLAGTWTAGNDWRWVITSRRVGNDWRTEQKSARTDFIRFPSPVISPRRRRLPRPVTP